MEFENKDAEDYYRELVEEYGYIHINTGGKEVTMEGLESVRETIQDIMNRKKGGSGDKV